MGVLVPSPVSEVFNVTSGGSGYTQAPQVVLSRDAGDTTGSGASAVAVMNGDRVASIQLVTPGSDYAKPPVVSFVGACTSPATATAALDTGVTYRWTKGSSLSNGVQIPTASEASYTVTIPADVGQADTVSGMYSVTVTNNANRSGVVTDPFGYDGVWNLVLQWAPRVLKYPDARTEVEQNADVTLSAVVSASTRPQPVSYQWLFRSAANGGGSPTETLEDIMDPSKYQPLSDTLDNTVSGSNTPTLRLRSVSAQRNGRFVLRAQNEVQGQIQTVYTFRDNAGIDYGNVVVLNATNFQAPRINSLKIGPNLSDLRTGSYVARQGSSVVMTAEATGGALSYQWFRDRIPLLGQTGPTLNLYRVQTGQAGTYTVQVRNSKGFREAFVRLSVMRDSSQEAATGTVTVDRTLLRSFFSMPTIPQSGQLPVGTRLRLFGTVPTGSSLRGWNVRNTPDDGFSVPSTYVVNGALGQIIVGSGVTVITPKVGRSFAGSYNGLLTIGRPWDDFGASTVVDPGGTKGVVRLTVTSGGVVSGQAVVEGYTYPFTSMMDASGLATFTVQVSDGSRVVGTVQADITDGSVDAGLRVTLGNDTNKVPVNRPPTSSGGPNVVAREILYSLAACGNGVNFGENSTYTAAVCRGEWSSLGRGGVFFIRTTSATQASGFNPLVIVAGYLGNGSSFSYSGVPGLRYPDQAADAEDWDAGSRGSVSDAAGSLANYAMSELLLRKTGAIALPIHLNGESSTRPVIRPLVGTMIFSPQGIIGSLGLVDVDRPNTADASLVYSSNLIRGFAYQTNVGSTSATASGGGLPNTTVTFSSAPLASPFDADGKNAALYSEFTFPANSPFYPRGNAIAALTLKTTSYGSSFEQRTPLATESVASNISVAGGGKVVVRWLSSSLGTSSGADAGLFSTSFLEDNSDFQVGASRPNVPPVIFSGNTSQVTDRVYGVVLQSDSQKLSAGPGGYGFMIRGNAAQDSLSKTLGLGEVEVATSATNPNVRYFRTEAIQLRAQ
jgi:hypothetical protein